MTAIEALKSELARVQAAQSECMDDHGLYVRPECRYRYQLLCRQGQELKGCVDWFVELYKEGGEVGAKS